MWKYSNIYIEESEKMLELEETVKILQELDEKLKNLGESLWHN